MPPRPVLHPPDTRYHFRRRATILFVLIFVGFLIIQITHPLPTSALPSPPASPTTAPTIPDPAGFAAPPGFTNPNITRWAPLVDQVVAELEIARETTAGYNPHIIVLAVIEAESHGVPSRGADGEECIMQVSPALFDAAGVLPEHRHDQYYCVRVGTGYLHSGFLLAVSMGYTGRDLLTQGFAGYNDGHGQIGRSLSESKGYYTRYITVVDRVCPDGPTSC